MSAKCTLGIDLGGTNFRIGIVSADGTILRVEKTPVGQKRTAADIVKLMSGGVKKMRSECQDVTSIGIGIPGIVDSDEGVVFKSPHFPDWSDVKFGPMISQETGMSVVIDNDANMVAVGEAWLGAGSGLENFVMVTLGTGIGGGIICNGHIWRGDHGFAGEVGHTLINFDGPACNCGSRGCFEMYASATGLKHLVEDSSDPSKPKFMKIFHNEIERVTPKAIYDLAREGDIFASAIWKKFGVYLGAGLAGIVNTLGITNIVIGGGVSAAWDFFIKETQKELSRRTYKKTASLVRLHKAKLGDEAGILGSARTASS